MRREALGILAGGGHVLESQAELAHAHQVVPVEECADVVAIRVTLVQRAQRVRVVGAADVLSAGSEHRPARRIARIVRVQGIDGAGRLRPANIERWPQVREQLAGDRVAGRSAGHTLKHLCVHRRRGNARCEHQQRERSKRAANG